MFILVGYFLVLLVSFYLLAKVCEKYFVSSLEKIAQKLRMSSDVAGATLMAIGSSAPELFIVLIAVFKAGGGYENIGAGTIVGSALFNILVIIGASAIIRTAVLSWQPIVRDSFFYSISIIWLLFSFYDGFITWFEALIFVLLYVIYILAVIYWPKLFPYPEINPISEIDEPIKSVKEGRNRKNKLTFITGSLDLLLALVFKAARNYWHVFIFSIAIIAGLSWVLVDSAVGIAHILKIPETIIALTILAFGTSVPDLMSSLIVAKKGRGGMAISNAVGSNIFDVLFALGVPWLLVLSINRDRIITVDTHNLTSSIFLLFATVVATFFIFLTSKWKIGKTGGWILIACYIGYLVYVINSVL